MSSSPEQADRTRALLIACRDGDRRAFEELVAHLYDDLRRVARRQLYRARPGETLDTTGLVHETYLKLVGRSPVDCDDRAHFLGLMARAMRQVIIDYSRRRRTEKRGGDRNRVPLEEADPELRHDSEMLIALDEALDRLGSHDPRLVRLVECRFFAGFTEEETAEVLGVSRSTVQRDWIRARAWLRYEIGQESGAGTRG